MYCLFVASCCRYSTSANPNDYTKHVIEIHIDNSFSQSELESINRAMNTWESVSNNKIVFVARWNVKQPGLYQEIASSMPYKVFLWNMPKSSAHFKSTDWDEVKGLDGVVFSSYKNVHVMVFKSVKPHRFYQVTVHELGHLLGIDHIKTHKALMDTRATSACVTQWDAHALCAIHHCVPSPECRTR